jgi:Uma2 family endonuclease
MKTLSEIQLALERLSKAERQVMADWFREFTEMQFGVQEPQAAHAEAEPLVMTLDEYLDFEGDSEFRHEYVNGSIYAMSRPTMAHMRITRELLFAVGNHLRGGPCEVFSENALLHIRTEADEIMYYPDLMVLCQPDKVGPHYARDPKLVCEVLSPSTQRIDRREKAMTYRRGASLEEYVLVAQDKHQVAVHRRQEDWQPRLYEGPQTFAEFRSIGLSLPLAQIYEGAI